MMNYFWFAVFIIVLSTMYINHDDTDKHAFKRSGMYLYTDYKTGLQYLGDKRGGITPRLDLQGKHMRIEK